MEEENEKVGYEEDRVEGKKELWEEHTEPIIENEEEDKKEGLRDEKPEPEAKEEEEVRIEEPEVKKQDYFIHEKVEEKVKSMKKEEPLKESSCLVWKVAAAVLIVILAFMVFKGGFGYDGAVTGGTVVDNPVDSQVDDFSELIDDDYVLGDENAPVTIVEFSDYECPYCGRYSTITMKQIKERYVDTGKVKYVFRDFPLSFHQNAEPAAIAANCAGEQGKYYEFHDILFANQQELSNANYRKWAEELGLDMDLWDACMSNPTNKQEVQKDTQDGAALGVRGTPAFFINGELITGAQTFSVFQEKIEAALSG